MEIQGIIRTYYKFPNFCGIFLQILKENFMKVLFSNNVDCKNPILKHFAKTWWCKNFGLYDMNFTI